ncbi:MAG: chemotaxis protein CheW [Candidatus Dactylopiibacterium carminicum]|uniref:Chemotaxis protein CheW n=1 Tax=Candidatus Dactylopiibacterium carminicum TaxID=857335 RepID=A0A272EN49_9RHOO|nr:chemotaxis protein CheW [Candidatus Dactylopiibacterium carminicum]KAF7597948.1 chemotaxis protein CheW [Candidatus Dactylopiibacterium carminicum]PAS91522.1 MAG: chemotaxis protein CheW [Candidatus Dactylopiibacterium carminicum]PAS93111.1 MAG: chemotaxis protein CheW [Candidatus Dactylopiibacterium carminicum]
MSNIVAVQPALSAAQTNQYLTFLLGGELFAIGILSIKEIIEYGKLTTIPMMPQHIRGVINLRGAVVPVVDLSARFGQGGCEITRRTCIVIIEIEAEGERQDIGVIVDAVCEVQEIPGAHIEPPPAFGANIRTDFIAGMGKLDERFVVILNVDHVLSLDELAALGALHGSLDAREGETTAA